MIQETQRIRATNLGLINAENFRLLRRAKLESGDVVDDEEDNVGHDGGVGDSGDGSSELPSELLVVVVDPATCRIPKVSAELKQTAQKALTGDHGVAVKASDARVGEEGGEEGSDESSDAVESKSVDGVVNLEKDLDSRAVVGSDGGEETDGESSRSSDESSSGSDSDREQYRFSSGAGERRWRRNSPN